MDGRVSRRQVLQATGGTILGGATLTGMTGGGAAQQAGEEWRQFGYDDANTGYAPNNTGPVADISEQWQYETGGKVDSSPAVVDGTVYVGSDDGLVYALSGQTDGRDDSLGLLPVVAGLGVLGLGGSGLFWLARNGDDDGDAPGGQTAAEPGERPPTGSTDTTPSPDGDAGDSVLGAVERAVETGDDHRDAGRQHLDDGQYDAALDAFAQAREAYETARERASEHDLVDGEDIDAKLDALATDRETVEQRLRGGPPAEILCAPDIDVDYESLTEEEPIGSGGNADVTRATLPAPGGDVTLAVKKPRMNGTLHTETVDRLLDEAETWDKLDDHDHVVGVVDYDSEPLPWIAMEYMDAGHLGERAGELDTDQALWTAISITRGVRHAHRRGVAHLDLKPSNVLFREVDGAWDVPKVADWGLSKHLLEHSKSIDGLTVEYAAPEQFDDSRGASDDITDVYQLGAVFYELFTGRPPFEGQPFEVIEGLKNDRPAPPSEIADVPGSLDDVLLTALAKRKRDRYDNVAYLRDALIEIFDDR